MTIKSSTTPAGSPNHGKDGGIRNANTRHWTSLASRPRSSSDQAQAVVPHGNPAMKFSSSHTGKAHWMALVLIALAIAGLSLFWLMRDRDNHDGLRLYGNVDIREVELAFRQPGRMASMVFDEGDAVSAGTVMARLDATPYHQKMAAAEAELRAAQARLAKLRSGNRPQEIAQAQERVRQAQAAARETERNFRRQNSLLDSGASSHRVVDAARAARDQATADLAAAKAALSLARDGFRSEDVAVVDRGIRADDFEVEVVDQAQSGAAAAFRIVPRQRCPQLFTGCDIGNRIFVGITGLQTSRIGALEYAQTPRIRAGRAWRGVEPEVRVEPHATPTVIVVEELIGRCRIVAEYGIGAVKHHGLHHHAARVECIGARLAASRIEPVSEELTHQSSIARNGRRRH